MRTMWLLALPVLLTGCVTMETDGSYSYKDMLRPHGHSRSEAALQRDIDACDRNGKHNVTACMRHRGWGIEAAAPVMSQDDASASDDAASSSPPDTTANDDAAAAIQESNDIAAMNASEAAAEQQNEAAQQQVQIDESIAAMPQ